MHDALGGYHLIFFNFRNLVDSEHKRQNGGCPFDWIGWNFTKQVIKVYVDKVSFNFNQFDLPTQVDTYNCGLFVCLYARQLLHLSKVSHLQV